ncbi:MAG TPA: tetratricopeptide repeat protein [Steroidobacteraceae bacterium]
MNKVANVVLAAAVAMAVGNTVSALAADEAPPKGQVSAAAGKELKAANQAVTEKKYEEAIADLDKVKANPKKNEYDEYVMNELSFNAYGGLKRYAEAEAALESIIGSKYMPPEELKKRVVTATILNNILMNYDKAIQFGTRAIKDGYGTPQVQLVVAQSYYLKKDYKNDEKFIRTMVDDQIKAGQAPSEEVLRMGYDSSNKLDDDTGETRWLELLVTYHPMPDYWSNLMDTLYHGKLSDKQLLQVYRLSADVGVLKRGTDYAEMAQLALATGSPGEAVSVLNKGFAANAFTEQADKNRNTHLLDSAKKQAATDEPTLAKTEADAANAPSGDKLVGVGIGYFGYGDYTKASKDIAAGLAKGTTTADATDARLLLGIAQLKGGDKDAAIKTFKSVKGDPVLQRLADLWVLHAKAG